VAPNRRGKNDAVLIGRQCYMNWSWSILRTYKQPHACATHCFSLVDEYYVAPISQRKPSTLDFRAKRRPECISVVWKERVNGTSVANESAKIAKDRFIATVVSMTVQ
jgi:hypothetical protein